jgi:choline-sulfatase
MGKQNMYEHSLRPPMIVTGPTIPKNERISAPVYLQDIMPTTLELAGVTVPQHVEFRSLLPLIRGERDQQYKAIYGAYCDGLQRAVIEDGWKLIHYPAIEKTRLFNLQRDPLEMDDLADNPQWAAKLQQLNRTLEELQTKMDDPLVGSAP